eukprot:6201598-Pleurochrysis_carterae.AAC.2
MEYALRNGGRWVQHQKVSASGLAALPPLIQHKICFVMRSEAQPPDSPKLRVIQYERTDEIIQRIDHRVNRGSMAKYAA